MFISNRFLSKTVSDRCIRKYYANLRPGQTNHNRLNYSLLRLPPFPITGEDAFELLEAAFDLQEVHITTV
jgi:hypothetical protein